MIALRALMMLVVGATLSACTSLSTVRMSPPASDAVVSGVDYRLPLMQFDLKVTRTLSQCFEPRPAGSKAPLVPSLKFVVKAEATSGIVAGETFKVDYKKLSGFTKTSSITFEWNDNGTLKSLNATAEDRSDKIIADVVKTAINVAKIAAGIPGGSQAPGLGASQQMVVCADGTQKFLDDLKLTTAALKLANDNLSKQTKAVTGLTEKLKLGTLNETGKAKLEKAIEEQTAQAAIATERQAAVDRASGALTVTSTTRAPRDTKARLGYLALSGRELTKLLLLVKRVPLVAGPNAKNECNLNRMDDCISEMLQAQWVLEPAYIPAPPAPVVANKNDKPARIEKPAPPISADVPQKGVFVRQPVAARLLICRTSDELSLCSEDAPEVLYTSTNTMVPQLGTLLFLSFENGVFQNNSLAISLRENGGMEKFEYKELKARGEVAASAAAGVSDQALAFTDAQRKKKTIDDAVDQARAKADRETQIALMQFELDQLTLKGKIDAFGETRVATLQAEIDRITKEKDLEKLTQPVDVSVLDTIKAETALSNARASLYAAQRAERLARAELEK